MAPSGADDWRAAAEVESYGFTWGSCRHGDEPWKQFHAVDLVRAAARGKPFWHAEAYGGPLWMQPQVIGKPRDEGRIASPEDIRYWDLVSSCGARPGCSTCAGGRCSTGRSSARSAPTRLDGSRTDRSEMAPASAGGPTTPRRPLWQSRPVRARSASSTCPRPSSSATPSRATPTSMPAPLQGAYQAFFDHNIQADWVHIDHIAERDALYLPFPVMLTQQTADRLRQWVEAGGTLIAEGCPAYFGDRGHVGATQPNLGLDELFGARESYVEFTPDLLGDLRFHLHGMPVWGGIFMQAYEPTTGTPVGWYDDGRVAAVDNAYGQGRTRLIGTMAGAGYAAHRDGRFPTAGQPPLDHRPWSAALAFAGKAQHVRCSEPRVKARLHDGPGGTYLWVANPTRHPLPVRLELSAAWGPFSSCHSLWGGEASADGRWRRSASYADRPRARRCRARASVGQRIGLILAPAHNLCYYP